MPFPIEPTGTPRRAGAVRALSLAALLVVLPLALGGCSWLGMGGSDDEEEDPLVGIRKLCPTVGVLDGADRITIFSGRGRDLTDIVLRAEIRKSAITPCEYDADDGTISFDVGFDGTADLGPAATSRDMNIPGFVAVTRHGYMVSKRRIDIPVSFEGASRTVRFLKTVEGTTVPFGGELNGSAYEIIVGFQLTPEELDYNRKVPATPLR